MAIGDIATRARTEAGPPPWRTCQVCHALATLPEAEAQALRELLAGRMRYAEIEKALQEDPDAPKLHRDALSRHARGRCDARERLR